MTEKEWIAKVGEDLDLERKRLLALPLVEFAHEYWSQFRKPAKFAIGQANLVEQMILDRQQHALRG